MEHQPTTEPGLGSSDQKNLEAMSIQELVSVLRTAFLTEDFDEVEDVLVSRYNKLQTENLHLQEKFQLEKLARFQAEEDLRKREELCERGKKAQNNYETLLKQVKKKTSFVDRDIIGELRKKNNELELEVCELRKLKKKWVDDSNVLAEPPNKRSKDAQGASSSDSSLQTSFAAIIEELRKKNNELELEVCELRKMKEKWVDSNVQKRIVTQNKVKRTKFAINSSPNSFDNFRFISMVHQERYFKFLDSKRFLVEKNLQVERDRCSDIQAMIVARGWGELTSFAKDASTTLAKEFFANAYQGPTKEYGNDKNDLKQFTSFVRGKMVPFDENVINQLFGLENYEQCSFEARRAASSCYVADSDILCKPKAASWILNKDGRPEKLRISDLTSVARVWATFVLRNLLCSNLKALTVQQATLVTAILKGEPVNVGRLLADDLWGTANCSSPTSYINHSSLISKLCERVGIYPENDEELVMPCGAITADRVRQYSRLAQSAVIPSYKISLSTS